MSKSRGISRQLSKTLAGAIVVIGIGCSPSAPSPPPAVAVAKDLAIHLVAPVAGKPAEHTGVRILGAGFQPGAIVTFDGIATQATVVNDSTIHTTAPPHPAGAIDVLVTNPDGRTSRLEMAFTYVEDLVAPGDITIAAGESVTAVLGRDQTCTFEDVPCRVLLIRAPAGNTLELELVLLDPRKHVGLYTKIPFLEPTDFPKTVMVSGGQQVWVIGEFAVFTVTAHLQQ